MILTTCAACAAPLAHDAPGCARCLTRYCSMGNLAITYSRMGRNEEALRVSRDVYFAHVRLDGEENEVTMHAATNYAWTLVELKRFEEAKALLHETILVARRVLGETGEHTLRLRCVYGQTLYLDTGASLCDLREAVTTLEETVPIVRRVLGGAHPTTRDRELDLQDARAALRAREPPPPTERALRDARAALRATP